MTSQIDTKKRRKYLLNLLKRKGKTVDSLAVEQKVTVQSVYQALDGGCSTRVRISIARIIGYPPSMLWAHVPLKQRVLDDYAYLNGWEAFEDIRD